MGDFTYFADKDFERHVTHHYDFNGDKLIIGKFKWWDKSIDEINSLIPILTRGDLKKVKAELKARLV